MENQSTEQNEATGKEMSSDAQSTLAPSPEDPLGTDHQEIEWQYDISGSLEKVEEWLGDYGSGVLGITVLRGRLKGLTDTYYDTGDWQLYQAGYALRIRQDASSSEATMKSIVSGTAGNLHRRREISEPMKSNEIDALLMSPGLVGVRLRELIGSPKLCRIFEVRTRRRTFDLLLDEQLAEPEKAQTGGSAVCVGEVALDYSEIPLDEGPACLTRVEVEVNVSAASVFSKLEGFVRAMEVSLGLRPTETSKYEVGLSITGQNQGAEGSLQKGGKKG